MHLCMNVCVCVKVCKSLRVSGFGFGIYGRSQLVFQAGFPPFAKHSVTVKGLHGYG